MVQKLNDILTKRINHLSNWMKIHGKTHIQEQKHLDNESEARAYFNYGYLMALMDTKKLESELNE